MANETTRLLPNTIDSRISDYTGLDVDSRIEKIIYVVFGAMLVSAQACEVYLLMLPVFQYSSKCARKWLGQIISFTEKVQEIAHDFRSRRYYKPWSRKKPVLVEAPDHMQELSDAHELSQRAVYADIFGFKHNMKHTQIDLDPNEQNKSIAARYRLYARAIRVIGISEIPKLMPYLQNKTKKTVVEYIDESRSIIDGWKSVTIAPMMRELATGTLGLYFFGETLCEEPEFASAMEDFYDDVIRCMGVLQMVPGFMEKFVYSLITRKGHALNVLFARLTRTIEDRDYCEGNSTEGLTRVTLWYHMVEMTKDSDYWTHERLIQAVIGIWFAASHQPWINLHFVFLELCARPDYVEMIRSEIQAAGPLDYTAISTLPILDSFIKESVRLNPLDRMAIRRKALESFTFSKGGPHVPEGAIACVPAWEIMHNKAKYHQPDEFDGLRFVARDPRPVGMTPADDGEVRGSTFTDATKDFPIWGYGSKVCPGRWHAALVLKLAIVQLVTTYDFRVEDEKAPQKWWWETFQMPYESTKVLFRKRVA